MEKTNKLKIFAIFLSFGSILLMVASCEPEQIEEPIQDEVNLTDEILDQEAIAQIGEAHNIALDAIIHSKEFRSHYFSFSNARRTNGSLDTLAMVKLLHEQVLDFADHNSLLYNKGKKIDVRKYCTYSDEDLLNLFGKSKRLSKARTTKQNYYEASLKEILSKNEFNPEVVEIEVNKVIEEARERIKNPNELNSVLATANVLINSHKYWLTFSEKNARSNAPNPCAVIPILGTTLADVEGASAGGVLGAIIGPVGIAAGAFGFGASASLTSYAINLIDCGLNKPGGPIYGGHGGNGGSGVGGSSGGSSGYDPGSSGGWKSSQNGSWEKEDPCDKKRNRTAAGPPWARTATVVPCN